MKEGIFPIYLISRDEGFHQGLLEHFEQSEGPVIHRFHTQSEALPYLIGPRPPSTPVHVLADQDALLPQDLEFLIRLHQGSPFLSLVLLDPQLDPKFSSSRPLRFSLPLSGQFASLVGSLEGGPVIFLVDTTALLCQAVQSEIEPLGLQPVVFDSPLSVFGVLRKTVPQEAPRGSEGFLGRLGRKASKEPEAPRHAIVPWEGGLLEQIEFERQLKKLRPEARCLSIVSGSPLSQAEIALRTGKPAFLSKAHTPWIPRLLRRQSVEDPNSKGRILLVDNDPQELAALARALWTEGYEVVAHSRTEQALEASLARQFHIAVVGSALAHAELTGKELSSRLRERDPHVRIILLVDRYPLQTALQGLSQVVEVGLDDCLLKPVDPSSLQFAVSRAMEKRRLVLENLRLVEELRKSNGQLVQHNNFQSKFFAMVTHDVRNPLTAILGCARLLEGQVATEKAATLCQTITRASHALNALVSDLVDLAAIESGKLTVAPARMDLAEAVREVGSRISIVAQQKGVLFQIAELPTTGWVQGDRTRLEQVLTNLCSNALQYTPAGGRVTLGLRVEGERVVASVEDSGIGISPEDLPRIFDRFFQAPNAREHHKKGFGLGLTIAKEIMDAHQGRLEVESKLGQGSCFRCFFPLLPQEKHTEAPYSEFP